MASAIVEIPIESSPVAEVDVGAEEAQASAPPEPAAKKRGRPKGSKNRVKEPPAPRAAAELSSAPARSTAAAQSASKSAVREPSPASEEEAPPPKKRNKKRRAPSPDSSEEERPQEQPLDSRAIAAEVLQMLSQRHLDQRQAKREKYRSWFH